ncbi:MAG TPA: hypothetical protein VKU02_03480 [Gemmataceae bacterium]|nr:hypothetical protein [Gemmataceae bacterium]
MLTKYHYRGLAAWKARRSLERCPADDLFGIVPGREEPTTPYEGIKEKLQQRPFVPFGIVLTDGRTYEIRHPGLLLLGKRSAVVGLVGDPADTVYDRYLTIALLHIARLEPLDTSAVSG